MALWDTYGSYGVALVDKLGVKYMHYQFSELVDTEGLMGEDVRSVKAGRGSSVVGRRGGNEGHAARRSAEIVRRNLKESAAAAAAFFSANACQHILIGGTEDVMNEFIEALPAPWPARIAATFPAEIDMHEGALRELALQHLTKAVQQREYTMVDSVITAAAKGSNGVVRLDETLSAAQDGRIQMLLVAAGYDAAGYRCATCGYLTTQAMTQCPFCSGTFTYIPHAVEAAIEQVVAQGGDVKTIDHHAQLDKAGVAALLRY
jgi:rubrerythrin